MSKRKSPVVTPVQLKALAMFVENSQNDIVDIRFYDFFKQVCMNTRRALMRKRFILMDLNNGVFKITRSGLFIYIKFKNIKHNFR